MELRMNKYILILVFILFFNPSYSFSKNPELNATHTEAEKVLDSIFKDISKKNFPKDKLSKIFLEGWGNRSKITDLFCVAYFIDNNPIYSTLESNVSSVVISYSSPETGKYKPLYKMLRTKNGWKLDGILCDEGFSINMPKHAAEYCNQDNLPQGSVKGCRIKGVDGIWDKQLELNNKIRKRLKNNPERLEKFEKAHKAWKAYVDAQTDFLYSHRSGTWALHKCSLNSSEYYIKERVKELESWIKYSNKGNICGAGLE